MLRLIGFFVLVLVCMRILSAVPVLGRLMDVPFLGFWVTAILVSAAIAKLASRSVDRRKLARQKQALGAVVTPHNQGKLGSLLLAAHDPKRAIAPLENAVRGEPTSVEWPYRLGCALLETKRPADAVVHLERAASMDEEHAYGAVQLRLAEALYESGRTRDALAALDRFDRNHGPNPESAFRRGRALRKDGRAKEARASFRAVKDLARHATHLQRSSARGWVWRAFFAQWV